MTKIDQLFLTTARKLGLIDDDGLKQIATIVEEGKGDAADTAVELGLISADKSSKLIYNIETKVPPENIPGFDVISHIGRGATSTVWKARQESLGKTVALKVFSTSVTKKSQPDQLISEARNAARLNHPHIVHAIDAGISDGCCWFAMELVEGETLHQKLKRRGVLSERELGEFALCITQGLSHAHSAGLLHRDLKPGNILISEDGVPKITDLGLALAEEEAGDLDSGERRKGTPHYISPEQIRGDNIDARSDLYSLGATLYHCATGRPPFQGKSTKEILKKHLHEELIPVDTLANRSSPIHEIIEKLLSKTPSDRFSSADEVIEALNSASVDNASGSVSAPRSKRRVSSTVGGKTPVRRVVSGVSRGSLQSKNTLISKIGIGIGIAVSMLMAISAASKANQEAPGFQEQIASHRDEIYVKKIKLRMDATVVDHEREETNAEKLLQSILSQDQDIQIRALQHALKSHCATRASVAMSEALDRIRGDIVRSRQQDGRVVLAEATVLANDGKLWPAIKLLDDRSSSARKDQDLNNDIEKLLSNWEAEIDSRFAVDFQKIGFHRDRREFSEALALIDEIEGYADPDTAEDATKMRDTIIQTREKLALDESKRRLTEESSKYRELWADYQEKALARDIKGMISLAVSLDAELAVQEVKDRLESDLLAFSLLDGFIKEALQELVEKGESGKEVALERIPLGASSKNRIDRGVVDRVDSQNVWIKLSSENAILPMKIIEITDAFLFQQVSDRHGKSSVEYRIPLGLLSMYRGLFDIAAENFRIAEEKGTRPDTWIEKLEWVKKNALLR